MSAGYGSAVCAMCLVGLCAVQSGHASSDIEFFVSSAGDDAGPGTRAHPFRTVERARDAVRAARAASGAAVVLKAGTYRLAEPLRFGPEDSGSPGSPVVYRAEKPGSVVLSGGRPITGWVKQPNGLYRALAPKANFRQLYVNGVRATRARGGALPDCEPWGELKATIKPLRDGVMYAPLTDVAEAGFRTSNGAMAKWRNPSDIELGFFLWWSHMICRVESIRPDGDGAILSMAQPGFLFACRKGGVQADIPAYVENALELLDEPGEWYLDRAEGAVYYMPRPGEDLSTAEVIAPVLTELVRVEGTPDEPAHDIRFEGIAFSHATWLRPSEYGHPDVQANFILAADMPVFTRPEFEKGYVPVHNEYAKSPANVVVHAGHRIDFAGCAFRHLGGAGLDLEYGAQGNAVAGCLFEDISATGIQVGDVQRDDHHPSRPALTVRGNRVTNNHIRRVGVEFEDSIGIFCGFTDGTLIAHNEIHDLPYSGVSVGWGWGEEDAGGGAYVMPFDYETPTAARLNQIEFNHIHHCMQRRSDGGGIYTLSRQPGTVIRGNHIHDNGPGVPGGIYLDEGSSLIEVSWNLVHGVATAMNYNNRAQNRIATCEEHDNVFGLIESVPGIVGRAMQCRSGLLEVPHSPELDPQELTVEAWVRLPVLPSGWDPRGWVVCKAPNEFADGNYSLIVDSDKVGAYLNMGGGQESFHEAISEPGTIRTGVWQHLAMTYDGIGLRVFCDGRQVAEKAICKRRTTTEVPLTLGGRQDRYGPGYLLGELDDVVLFDRALSADEIAQHYETGQRGQRVQGATAEWTFDDLPPEPPAAAWVREHAGLEPAYRDVGR